MKILKGVVLMILLLWLVGCVKFPQEETMESYQYVWPMPPQKPKIRYIKSIWGQEDIRKAQPSDVLFGKEPMQDLLKPYGLFVDMAGRIYVTDTLFASVFVFDEALGYMHIIGARTGLLRSPADVVVDSKERVYVSDAAKDEVVVFDQSGDFIREFGKGILDNPAGMAIDDVGERLYVVSNRTHSVEVFSLEGRHLFSFGSRGVAPGMFNFPLDIAIGPDGNLYVLDAGNFRVQIFTPEGVFIRQFGHLGTGPGQFSRPKGIAVDNEGYVYVTDAAFNNYQIFDSQGRLMLFVGTGGSAEPGEFLLPADIEIDQRGYIYVADQMNRRVQIFKKLY